MSTCTSFSMTSAQSAAPIVRWTRRRPTARPRSVICHPVSTTIRCGGVLQYCTGIVARASVCRCADSTRLGVETPGAHPQSSAKLFSSLMSVSPRGSRPAALIDVEPLDTIEHWAGVPGPSSRITPEGETPCALCSVSVSCSPRCCPALRQRPAEPWACRKPKRPPRKAIPRPRPLWRPPRIARPAWMDAPTAATTKRNAPMPAAQDSATRGPRRLIASGDKRGREPNPLRAANWRARRRTASIVSRRALRLVRRPHTLHEAASCPRAGQSQRTRTTVHLAHQKRERSGRRRACAHRWRCTKS